ncbi:hypothetical protein cyc_01145 [Cyclospora cayetanensis]|uniref:Transmembrane protein n=1 Tax=Cyclospora cayetanensis TaxID=88456 RepID=A0A1D3D9Z8_9EIME|nr:hypothetical protein cyc_01145 [Cyclospora cayetanensis]
MQPSPSSSSRVPPGFSRVLTVGEVPLMAGSSHNKHPGAQTKGKQTYTMLLPPTTTTKGVRGYHALRFVRLRRLHGRQMLQKYCFLIAMGVVGIMLLLWSEVTSPLLQQLQQLRRHYLYSAGTTAEDVERCEGVVGSPRVYAEGSLIALWGTGRRELLREALENELQGASKPLLSIPQHEGLLGLFEVLANAFRLKQVRWALAGSSLASSLFRHDLLPGETVLSILVDEQDKKAVQESCAMYNPMNELLKPQKYISQTLLSWVAATKTKPKFEEQALNAPFGLIHLDTSKASEDFNFPSLSVRTYWYKTVTEKPRNAEEDWEPYAVMGGGPSRITMPMGEWAPFVERPLGLLAVPTPRNPLYYLTRLYKTANPLCASAKREEGAAGKEAGNADGSTGSSGIFSLLPASLAACSDTSSFMKSYSMPFVSRAKVTPDCLKESFYLNGELQLEIYTKSRYTPAPEFASWLLPSWR